jgi:hypothetical protein
MWNRVRGTTLTHFYDPLELPRLLARARSTGLFLDLVDAAPDACGR